MNNFYEKLYNTNSSQRYTFRKKSLFWSPKLTFRLFIPIYRCDLGMSCGNHLYLLLQDHQKKRSLSGSESVRTGAVQNQQKSVEETSVCSL